MAFYVFDETPKEINKKDETYDISGSYYREFIETCCRYSAYFSFRRYQYKTLLWEPEPKAFPSDKDLCFISRLFDSGIDLLYVFKCNERTKNFLQTYTKGLQYWYNMEGVYGNLNMPEDLSFYREDGSCLFYSQTHEGDIKLFLRDDEDFSNIIVQPGWRKDKDYSSELMTPGWLFSREMVSLGSACPEEMAKHWCQQRNQGLPQSLLDLLDSAKRSRDSHL